MIRLILPVAATLALLMPVTLDPALAQIQDAYVQKTYCVDERGNEIRFFDKQGDFPPRAGGERGAATIFADQRMLSDFSPPSQQFLFTRACLEAAYLNLGIGASGSLECETARFMMRRFKIQPSEIYKIVAELGDRRESEGIARSLSGC